MKKKIIWFGGIVVFALCVIVYFKPMPFPDIADSGNEIQMILSDFGFENGKAKNESVKYTNITAEQKREISVVLENFKYRRNFKTPFSDGSISDLGDKLLSIYVYENDLHSDSVMISSSGKILVNHKNYSMKDAEKLIEQIIDIVEQKD